jgi:hypothetical protein
VGVGSTCLFLDRVLVRLIGESDVGSVFSPVQVAVLFAMDVNNWLLLLPIASCIALQLYVMAQAYGVLVHDKQILFEQVYSEYNDKFVYKRLFKQTADKSVQTNGGVNGVSAKKSGLGKRADSGYIS